MTCMTHAMTAPWLQLQGTHRVGWCVPKSSERPRAKRWGGAEPINGRQMPRQQHLRQGFRANRNDDGPLRGVDPPLQSSSCCRRSETAARGGWCRKNETRPEAEKQRIDRCANPWKFVGQLKPKKKKLVRIICKVESNGKKIRRGVSFGHKIVVVKSFNIRRVAADWLLRTPRDVYAPLSISRICCANA